MAVIKCKMCGGDLSLSDGQSVAQCEYCGSKQTVPSADDARKMTLFMRANRLRAACEFDKAAGVYESIVADFPEESEAYWGLVLCRYGIEYVTDPKTGKRIPTCHRSSFDSVLEDEDFEQALENADVVARRVYREEAKVIEEIRRGIVEVSGKEKPYDIFICYKETDENGERTIDSVIAQEVYDALTKKGYRVFFARITLEEKLGVEYEPYIFAALNSARLMLVFGTDYEYFNAVWVKNEWNRFLSLMEAGKRKTLIPCFKGIDAYDLPKEFARLQAQDMGKVGAMQDLLRGVDKIMGQNAAEPQAESAQPQQSAARPTVQTLLERASIMLEDGEFEGAARYFERVLDIEPRNAQAYLGKVLVQAGVGSEEALVERLSPGALEQRYLIKTACPVDEKRIGDAIARFAVLGYLLPNSIRLGMQQYNRTYQTTVPYLNELLEKQRKCLDEFRDFSRAEKYAEGEFAEHMAQLRQRITQPQALCDAFDKASQEEQERIQSIREGYVHFLDEKEQEFAKRHEAALKEKERFDRTQAIELEQYEKRTAERKRRDEKIMLLCKIGAAIVLLLILLAFVNARFIAPDRAYRQAQALFDAGDDSQALVMFESLGGYQDAADRALEIRYTQAEAMLEAGDDSQALVMFESLGGYQDAADRALEIRYTQAKALLDAGDYDAAAAAFEELGEYNDAAVCAQKARYAKAEALLEAGDKARAAMAFGALGDYRDARSRSFSLWNEIVKQNTFVCDLVGRSDLSTGYVFGAITNAGKVRIAAHRDTVNRVVENISEWGDLISLAIVGDDLLGLRADGRVVSTNKLGENWTDVVYISGFSNFYSTIEYALGLKSDGTIVTRFPASFQPDLSEWNDIVMVVGSNYEGLGSSKISRNIAGLKADGTVIRTGGAHQEDWTDIISIVLLNDVLVGLKKDGTIVVSDPDEDFEHFDKNTKRAVQEWRDIVRISGDTHNYLNYMALLGVRSDGGVLLSSGKEYPALPGIVTDTIEIAVDSPSGESIRIYGLDQDGNPLVYEEELLDRWVAGELTDEEVYGEARHLVWDSIDFSDWVNFKLPN